MSCAVSACLTVPLRRTVSLYRSACLTVPQGWNPALLERLECTKPEDIERRDVYDVIPSVNPLTWTKGRVVLLGDAVHAVQPNLGPGGGQVRGPLPP